MNTRLVVVILLLAVIVTLVILSWGLAARDGGSRRSGNGKRVDPQSALDGLLRGIDGLNPKPQKVLRTEVVEVTKEGQPVNGAGCLKPKGPALTVTRPCILRVTGDDGFFAVFKLSFRKLVVTVAKDHRVDMTFQAGSSLASRPDTLQLPKTAEDPDGNVRTTKSVDLRIPASGATLEITRCTPSPCDLRLSNLK